MSKATRQRQERLDRIRAIAAGKLNNINAGLIKVVHDEETDTSHFAARGGMVVRFVHNEESKPLGTDPEAQPGLIERMKQVANNIAESVTDLFHHNQQPLSTKDKRKRVMESLAERRDRQEKERKDKLKLYKRAGMSGGSVGDLKERFYSDETGDLEQLFNIYIR
jgi:hypothetical protein